MQVNDWVHGQGGRAGRHISPPESMPGSYAAWSARSVSTRAPTGRTCWGARFADEPRTSELFSCMRSPSRQRPSSRSDCGPSRVCSILFARKRLWTRRILDGGELLNAGRYRIVDPN